MYDKLVAQCPRFERQGKSVPHTRSNGYMFSVLNKEDELGIRFSKEQQLAYLEKYKTTLFKSHNAVMKGYILISKKMMKEEANLVDLLNESFDYVNSLPPK